MGTLMDLGISGTIIPLVGDRRDNRDLVGRYVRSARHFRDWTFWILSPITAVAFLAMPMSITGDGIYQFCFWHQFC